MYSAQESLKACDSMATSGSLCEVWTQPSTLPAVDLISVVTVVGKESCATYGSVSPAASTVTVTQQQGTVSV